MTQPPLSTNRPQNSRRDCQIVSDKCQISVRRVSDSVSQNRPSQLRNARKSDTFAKFFTPPSRRGAHKGRPHTPGPVPQLPQNCPVLFHVCSTSAPHLFHEIEPSATRWDKMEQFGTVFKRRPQIRGVYTTRQFGIESTGEVNADEAGQENGTPGHRDRVRGARQG